MHEHAEESLPKILAGEHSEDRFAHGLQWVGMCLLQCLAVNGVALLREPPCMIMQQPLLLNASETIKIHVYRNPRLVRMRL